MIDKWLHIEDIGGDPWILKIWASVNDAVRERKIKDLPNEVREQGLHISTRLDILPRIAICINAEVKELFSVAKEHEENNVFTKAREGRALRINKDLTCNLICDINSLLFELNSACELMKKLLESLYSHAGKALKKKKVGIKIKSIIENAGQSSSWFRILDEHRNFFIHSGTPYIAIDVTNGLGNYKLLIMKENLRNFENKEKFITLSELNEIVHGFGKSKRIIQNDLLNLFRTI